MHNRLLDHFRTVYIAPPPEEIDGPFFDLARHLDQLIVEGPEKTVALRKLLEARNQATLARGIDIQNKHRDQHLADVRAALHMPADENPTGDIHG